MNDKRGQQLTIGTVIMIVLGLAVLVFLIIGFTQGWDIFFGSLGTIDPGDVEILAQACKGYADAGLTISYCTFKEIDVSRGKAYINCRYSLIDKSLVDNGIDTSKDSLSCGEEKAAEQAACCELPISANDWDSTKINGKTCKDWTNSETRNCDTVNQ